MNESRLDNVMDGRVERDAFAEAQRSVISHHPSPSAVSLLYLYLPTQRTLTATHVRHDNDNNNDVSSPSLQQC